MIKRDDDSLFIFERCVIPYLKNVKIQEFSQFLDSMNILHQFPIYKYLKWRYGNSNMQKRLEQLLQPRVLFIHEIQSISVINTNSNLTIKGMKKIN